MMREMKLAIALGFSLMTSTPAMAQEAPPVADGSEAAVDWEKEFGVVRKPRDPVRSEEHTSELQSH